MNKPPILNNRKISKDTLRWLTISIRTAHLATTSVVFGGIILHQPLQFLRYWLAGVIVSGMLLLALEWMHDIHWPHRGKGLLVYLHIAGAVLIHSSMILAVPLAWFVLIIGSVGSHMPRRFRHWSIIDGPEIRNKD